MKKFLKKYLLYTTIIFICVVFLYILFSGKVAKTEKISSFLNGIENKTFDIRQNWTVNSRKHNENIVILAIDDATYEYVLLNYGEWPMPRYVYADLVDYIEAQKPEAIVFDLLFVSSFKNRPADDVRLASVFKKYDNVYTGFGFDDDEKNYPVLDEKFSVNLDSKINLNLPSAKNYRQILYSITENTNNIGHININKDEDGVLRNYIPFVEYQGKIYPHMSLLVAQKAMNKSTKNYVLDKNFRMKFEDKSYPITPVGTLYLNWYGPQKTFEHISMKDLMIAVKEGKSQKYGDMFFKDKIVYVGSTVKSLYDIKVTPTDQYFPGVETHATFVNNLIDNNIIHRLTFNWDFIITLILCLSLGVTLLRVEYSKINYKYIIPINFSILVITILLYSFISVEVMRFYNLWIALIMPVVGMIITFTAIYVIRYFFKSKDYEYTYRLATTDGLTELYNHRYFQEQMLEFVEKSKVSGKKFSLILTDIDFFKKFNDQYGHQAGDAVLRQVARTLKKHVKKTDYVCRYGGEEMSVILKNADKRAAVLIAQRLCDAVSATVCELGEDLTSNVTISLGVSTYPDDGSTPTELIEYADKGLYFAKENGRNQVGVIKNV